MLKRKKINPEIALGFLLASILWIAVLGWASSYSPTEMERQECQQATKNAGHKTDDCKSFWERTTSDPVAFFTFGLFVFSGALVVATVAIYLIGKKQARLAAETAERQLRAYVYIDKFICTKLGDGGPKYVALKIDPIWKNSGQTPTRNMRNHISWQVFDRPFRDNEDFVDLNEFRKPDVAGSRTFKLACPPGESIPAEYLLLWRNQIEQMGFVDGKITAYIYVWGWAEYNDVFEDTPLRRTEFCASLEIAGDSKNFRNEDVRLDIHGTHNRADEECRI